MGKIEDLYPELNAASSAFEWAVEKLANGAIILGEDHTRALARAVIFDLVTAGHVTRLFIELADMDYDMVETTKTPQGKFYLGKYLRTQRGADLSADPNWTGNEEIVSTFAYIAQKYANPIPFEALMEHAVSNNVKVYLYDNVLGEQTSKEAMKKRNQVMGESYQNVLGKRGPQQSEEMRAAGSVLLVGSAHLSGHRSIQAACNISKDRVNNLSKF